MTLAPTPGQIALEKQIEELKKLVIPIRPSALGGK